MATKRPPGLDYVLRTPHGRTEFKGAGPSSHAEGIELLFVALPDALARRKVIDALERKHAKLLAQESGPDLDADQQTAAQVAALGHQVHPNMALPSLTPGGHAARLAAVPNLSAAYDGFPVSPSCPTRDQGSSYHAFCSDANCAACYGVKP
jgi:hypothetical protein